MKFLTHGHVDYTYGGKSLPERYDWSNDPKGYRKELLKGANRCLHCGHKFLGSGFANFCNVCDYAMSPKDDDMLVLIKISDKEMKLVNREVLVKSRIRIPEDSNDQKFAEKINKIAENPDRPPVFQTALDIAGGS